MVRHSSPPLGVCQQKARSDLTELGVDTTPLSEYYRLEIAFRCGGVSPSRPRAGLQSCSFPLKAFAGVCNLPAGYHPGYSQSSGGRIMPVRSGIPCDIIRTWRKKPLRSRNRRFSGRLATARPDNCWPGKWAENQAPPGKLGQGRRLRNPSSYWLVSDTATLESE